MDSFLGNPYAKKVLTELLKWPFETPRGTPSPMRRFLLIGPNGSGKTMLARLALAKYHVMEFDSESMQTQKDCQERLNKFLTHRTIHEMMGVDVRPKAVLVDNLECVVGTTLVPMILKEVSKKEHIPVIFTACASHEKKLTDLKKKVQTLRISVPSMSDCYLYWREQPETKDLEDDILLKRIKQYHCQMHVLRQVFTMDHYDIRNDYVAGSRLVLMDQNIFSLTQEYMKTDYHWEEIDRLASMDVGQLVYLLHENGTKHLHKNDLTDLIAWSRIFCDKQEMEDFAYRTCMWSMIPMAKLYTLAKLHRMMQHKPPATLQNSCLWRKMSTWGGKLQEFMMLEEVDTRDYEAWLARMQIWISFLDEDVTKLEAEVLHRYASEFSLLPPPELAQLGKRASSK